MVGLNKTLTAMYKSTNKELVKNDNNSASTPKFFIDKIPSSASIENQDVKSFWLIKIEPFESFRFDCNRFFI